MTDTKQGHQDASLTEEGTQQSRVALPEATGDPENGKSLKAEQADQLSEADIKVLAAIDNYGSLEELGKLIASRRAELASWGGRYHLLDGLIHLAIDTNNKLPPDAEGQDIHFQTRATTYKRIKQEAAILDRLFQYACDAANIKDIMVGVRPLRDHPFFTSLDARQEIEGQRRFDWDN